MTPAIELQGVSAGYRREHVLHELSLTVGAGVNWQGRAYETVLAPPANRSTVVAQSGYALVSLMARYEIRKNVSATLNINNLTDRKYYSQVAFFNQGWYGSPRNATLSLRVQY